MAAAALPIDALKETQTEAAPVDPLAQYGENFEDLPEQLVNILKSTIMDFQKQEEYLRRLEVQRAARNAFYERGYQHIFWNEGQNSFAVVGAGGMTTNGAGQSIQAPRYVNDWNIFQPFGRIIDATLTQNAPGVNFRPMHPDQTEDMEAAETAEGYRHQFDRANDVKNIQRNISRKMRLGSRVTSWTRSETNPQKYGVNADGSPKHVEVTSIYGSLQTKVPILTASQDEMLYQILYDDVDIRQAKSEYPKIATKIKAGTPGLGENNYERYCRLGVLQGARSQGSVGQAFAHLVTMMHVWLRPQSFTGEQYDVAVEPMEEGPEGPLTIKQKFDQLFPEGVCVWLVGDEYAGAKAESMDDALCTAQPYNGDGQFGLAIMDPVIVVQDCFNDAMNACQDIWDTGWPSRWVSAEDQEFDGIRSQRADPYAIRLKKARNGEALEKDFYQEPNPEIPATFVNFLNTIQGPLPQFMLATPPALFGESMQDQKTASGYAQARAQAMGQLGIIWGAIQYMFSRIYYQACLAAAQNPDYSDGISVSVESDVVNVQPGKLRKGTFGAYPDEDSSFPESTEAKRSTLEKILVMFGNTPIGEQIASAPDNALTILTLNGFPELVIPEAEAARKQQGEIELLLRQSPLPPDPKVLEEAEIQHAADSLVAEGIGGPATAAFNEVDLMEPSIPVNEWDFHEWHAKKAQDWLNGQSCTRERKAGNDAGVLNVVLHWKAHIKFLAQQMMAAQAQAAAQQPQEGAPGEPPKKPGQQVKDKPPGAPGAATM